MTAHDTSIAAADPDLPDPSNPILFVAGANAPGGAKQALLKFDGLTGPHGVPAGATIVNVSLTLFGVDGGASENVVNVRHMLREWNESVTTWNSLGDGIQFNDLDASVTANATSGMNRAGYGFFGENLELSTAYWFGGFGPNYGWVIAAPDANTTWSFASSDHPDIERRPLWTIEYTEADVANPSYAQLAGEPPSPLKSAWFDWADDLRERRVGRVPLERPSTFYFAQNGDDVTGWGTIDHPWQTLAKAQSVLETSGGNERLRFRRGDIWHEMTTLKVQQSSVTVDAYGDPALPKPIFSRFQQLSNGWTHVGQALYKQPAPGFEVGWLREAADGFTRIYYRAANSSEAMNRARSWYFDATGTDPNSGGVPTVYVNAGYDATAVPGGFEVCPADGQGWVALGDNIRFENLRIEGQGITAGGQGYGLVIVQQGSRRWEFVGIGIEAYYTGYHAIGQIVQYVESKGCVTLLGVKAGLCVNRDGQGWAGSGDAIVYVAFGEMGGNEYYQYECEVTYGVLPSADWLAQPGVAHGGGFYCHTGSGGALDLVILMKTQVNEDAPNPVALLNLMDTGQSPASLDEVRGFIVEDEPGRVTSYWQTPNIAVINCIVDKRTPPAPYDGRQATFYYGSFSYGGWLINCTVAIDASLNFNGVYSFQFGQADSTKMINCHIDIMNAVGAVDFRNSFAPELLAIQSLLTNSIISFDSPGVTNLYAINDPDHLQHNAYYLPSLNPNPAYSYSADPGRVVLDRPYHMGVVPSPSSLLYDGGIETGLEYDCFRQPRGTLRTIGPVTGAGLPAPTYVRADWGVQSASIVNGSTVSAGRIDRFSVKFDRPVDLTVTALKLWGGAFPYQIGGFTYDSATNTARWTVINPLPAGHYVLELDGQPLRGFTFLPGDFDATGSVNVSDYAAFRSAFGTNQAFYDLDGDGDVDLTDLATFRIFFGQSV